MRIMCASQSTIKILSLTCPRTAWCSSVLSACKGLHTSCNLTFKYKKNSGTRGHTLHHQGGGERGWWRCRRGGGGGGGGGGREGLAQQVHQSAQVLLPVGLQRVGWAQCLLRISLTRGEMPGKAIHRRCHWQVKARCMQLSTNYKFFSLRESGMPFIIFHNFLQLKITKNINLLLRMQHASAFNVWHCPPNKLLKVSAPSKRYQKGVSERKCSAVSIT